MLLKVERLNVTYGARTVLQDLSFTLEAGQACVICGRAGRGRSTLLKAMMGLVPVSCGSIFFENASGVHDLLKQPRFKRVRSGLVWLPETKELFTELSVEENLQFALKASQLFTSGEEQAALKSIYERYPILQIRSDVVAGALSGGEQQLLAFARAAMVGAKADLLLLDEPTEGLAENWQRQVTEHLLTLQGQGKAILLVEQKMHISKIIGAQKLQL